MTPRSEKPMGNVGYWPEAMGAHKIMWANPS
jgi:hypothetical protein